MPLPMSATTTKAPVLSREALRARAVEKLAEIAAKKEAPAEQQAAEPKPGSEVETPPKPEPEKGPAKDPVTGEPKAEVAEQKPLLPPAEEKKEEKPTSEAMTAFYREQARLKATQEALNKRAADFEAKEKQRAEEDRLRTEDEALKKKDPYAWAEEHGLSLKGWNQRALNNGEKTAEEVAAEIADEKVSALKAEWEAARQKEREDTEHREKTQAIRRWDAELTDTVAVPGDGKPDKYRLTRIFGWQGMAKAVIHEQFLEDQKVYGNEARQLTNEEALARVEAHLQKLYTQAREHDKAPVPAPNALAQKQEPKIAEGGTGAPPRARDPGSPASPPPNPDEDAKLSNEERKVRRRQRALAKLG